MAVTRRLARGPADYAALIRPTSSEHNDQGKREDRDDEWLGGPDRCSDDRSRRCHVLRRRHPRTGPQIEPKGDAGFQVMAGRGGFAAKQNLKLELPTFQNDVIALRGLLAGERDSYEGGA